MLTLFSIVSTIKHPSIFHLKSPNRHLRSYAHLGEILILKFNLISMSLDCKWQHAKDKITNDLEFKGSHQFSPISSRRVSLFYRNSVCLLLTQGLFRTVQGLRTDLDLQFSNFLSSPDASSFIPAFHLWVDKRLASEFPMDSHVIKMLTAGVSSRGTF